MSNFLAMVLGTALDPFVIFPSIFIGWLSRRWWHLVLGAVGGGLALEFATRYFLGRGGIPLVEIAAVGVWATFTFILSAKRRQQKLLADKKRNNN